MLERVCPHCGAVNALDHHHCRACGHLIVAPMQRSSRATLATRRIQVPAHWQQTGRVVALGLLSVAAEAGLYWLQQRQRSLTGAPRTNSQHIVAAQQRIVEHWQGGQLRERTIERTVWFEPD